MDIKDCEGCLYENQVPEAEECDRCSRLDTESYCSCNINPPCSTCVDDHYVEK